MDASIVMPTYNKRAYLEQTLQSLVNQKDAPRFEVVVVDDCSSDDTPELVEALQTDYSLRYLRNPVNMGRSRARNVGLAACQGEVVIFVDDDRVVCEDFVYQHVQSGGPGKIVLGMRWEAIEDDDEGRLVRQFIPVAPSHAAFRSRAAISRDIISRLDQSTMTPVGIDGTKLDAGGTVYREDGAMGHVSFFDWPAEGSEPLAWLLVATGNLSAWRQDVLAAGSFDEAFSGWGLEDTELGYRMAHARTTIVYQPKAENYHLWHPKSLTKFQEAYNNWQYFYRKHPYYDAGMFMLYVLGQIPFLAYRAKVMRNPKTVTTLYSDADLQMLRTICALIDDVLQGHDVVLSLSPDVILLDKGADAIALLRPALHPQSQPLSLLCVDQAKTLILRFDGQTPLTHILQACRGSSHFSSMADMEAEIRRATGHLVRMGVLCAAHHPG